MPLSTLFNSIHLALFEFVPITRYYYCNFKKLFPPNVMSKGRWNIIKLVGTYIASGSINWYKLAGKQLANVCYKQCPFLLTRQFLFGNFHPKALFWVLPRYTYQDCSYQDCSVKLCLILKNWAGIKWQDRYKTHSTHMLQHQRCWLKKKKKIRAEILLK